MYLKSFLGFLLILSFGCKINAQEVVKVELVPEYFKSVRSVTVKMQNQSGDFFSDDIALIKKNYEKMIDENMVYDKTNGKDLVVEINILDSKNEKYTHKKEVTHYMAPQDWQYTTIKTFVNKYFLSTLSYKIYDKSSNQVFFTGEHLHVSDNKKKLIKDLERDFYFNKRIPCRTSFTVNTQYLADNLEIITPEVLQKLIDGGQKTDYIYQGSYLPFIFKCLPNKNLIEVLVKNGADINLKNVDGRTILHYLLQEYPCNVEMFDFLVSQGANITIKTKSGVDNIHTRETMVQNRKNLLFYFAVKNNNMDEAKKMIEQGAEPDFNLEFEKRKRPVFETTPLKSAYLSDNYEEMETLVNLGADINRVYYFEGYVQDGIVISGQEYSLLVHASKNKTPDIVLKLIRLGARAHAHGGIPISFDNWEYWRQKDNTEQVKTLLLSQFQKENKIYFDAIAAHENEKVKKMLEDGFHIDDSLFIEKQNRVFTAMEHAVYTKNAELAMFFIEKGVKLDYTPSLVDIAKQNNQTELADIIKTTLEKEKAKSDNKKYRKLIYQAIKNDSLEAYKNCVNEIGGYSMNDMESDFRTTLTDRAPQIAIYLIEQGVEIKDEHFDMLIKVKAPDEMFNVLLAKLPVNVKSFVKACEINHCNYFINKGIDPNVIIDDKNQNIIAHLLTKKAPYYNVSVNTITQLIKLGANANNKFLYKDKQTTPLIYCALEDQTFILSKLLEYGVDPNVQVDDGSTPLICAIKNKNYESAKVLLKQPKTDKTITDKQGKTALDYLKDQKKQADRYLKADINKLMELF